MLWNLFKRPRAVKSRSRPSHLSVHLERLEGRIAPAVVTPFTPIFSQNATGDIAIVGNTLETASTVNNPGRTQQDVTAAQNGVGANINNNNWNMAYVDVDNNSTTFDSSQSSLNLPTGASVLFAGLYWGSVTTTPAQAAAQNAVKFSTPASGGYVSLTGTVTGSSSFTGTPPGTIYQSFANVTSLVQAAGNGTYTAANVQATLETGSYAGWSLVVAYTAPGAPARNLTVFNGFAVQASTDPTLNIPISGFIAPPAGAVNAKVGVVAYEGDLGTTGDSMALNGKQLSDAVTPANNFFNSGISNLGVLQTAKNPNFVNQMGFDAKVVNAPSGAIPNSATSATINLTTSGDGFFPGVVTTAIDLFAPNLVATKTVADLTGGNSLPGDTLEYTVNVSNTGQDPAGNVVLTDPIPANTTYVPGSLRIVSGANTGGMTDAAGDDQAFFDAAHNQVVFNLGAGATAAAGGTLGIGAATSIRFRVQVDAGVAANTVIPNQAAINYKGVTTGFPFTSLSNAPAFTVANSIADIALAKTVSDPTPNVGDDVTFTVTATNNGPGPATGVTVADLLPPGLQLANAITSQGEYDGGTGLWTIGSLANGGVATLTIIATVLSPSPQTNTATISHTDSVDPNASNNQASATETPQLADLSVAKTVSDPTPNVGDTITYTVMVTNNGPNNATGVTVTDLLPAGLTFVSSSAGAAYDSATGFWTVGALANGGSAVLTITATVASPNATNNTAAIGRSDQFDPNTGNNSASALETPQLADLAISKTVDNPTPNVGAVITYTITLTDNGPDLATGITVEDNLPAGLIYLSSTASQGSYDPNAGIWTVGTIDTKTIGSPKVLTITARVTRVNVAPNTASILNADQFDPNTANNSATSPIDAQQADVSLSKVVDDPTPNVGEVVTFTLTVRDKGPSVATNVLATDLLPAGLTFVSATPSEGSYDSGTGVWTVGTVDTTTPQTLLIQARVVSPDPQTNTATVTAAQSDPNPNNNSDNATVTPQQADLAVSKTVDNPTPNVGDTVTFTVTLADNGPGHATNVVVNDPLPTGLSLISATPSEGTYAGGLWTVGTVSPGAPQTLTITAQVVSPDPQTNTASIFHSDQFDPDPTNNTDNAVVTPQQADLALVKTIDRLQPNVGDTVVFTVTLTNNGPSIATGVQVTDPLPSGLTFVSAIPSLGTYDSTTGLWTVGTVSPGAPQTLQIQATVVSPNPQLNTATITNSDQFDPNLGNNTASATETPQQADLQITKTVDNPTPNVGDTVTYTITVTNNGPNDATGVTVVDILPSQVRLSSSRGVGDYDPATGIWDVGTVSTGTSVTLTLTSLVVSPNPQANTATISHSDQFDPNTANNSDTASINPQQADLSLSKIVSDPTPNVGDTIRFLVTLSNNGLSNATGVKVTDLLPAGLTLVSSYPSHGSYNPATGVWTVGDLANGAKAKLVLRARVVAHTARTNTASIRHSDQFDPDTGNNTASATETPQVADLHVTKTVDDPTPNVGDTITFTITLSNAGPDNATNVRLKDLLPSGLALVSATPSQGSYDNSTGVWAVGDVASAAATLLTLSARVVSHAPVTNTATIAHSDQFDPITSNNSASATETPQQADLQVSKTVDNPTPNVGDTVTYTITVTNNGPNDATGVTVVDILPSQVRLSSSRGVGDYDPATGIWDVGTVPTGTSVTLTLTSLVVSPNPQANTAAVSHSDQFDPNTANNSDTASINPQAADLALSKTVDDPTPNVGDTVTFTVTLTNNGSAKATNVRVNDLLPAGLGFVSATPSLGTYTPATGIWVVGTVTTATPQTLMIEARVNSSSAQTNTASIRHSDQFDPDAGNNTASATETPQRADLQLSKIVSDPSPNVGDMVTFLVTLNNNGPDAATNVSVTDLLPAGLSLVSPATPSQGSYDGGTGVWEVGSLGNGAQATLALQARVDSPSAQTNTATITSSDQFDPNTGNNTASATETPQQADLSLSKTVDDPTPNLGDTITFTVTLTNNGPSPATNVQVTDLLPAGLTLVMATPSEGSYDAANGVWSVGTVALGPHTLTLQALVVSPSAQTNTATITNSDQFDPNPGNNAASATETPQQADLVVGKSVSNPTPNVGETITYTIRVTNAGPNDATGVTVQDILPGEVSFQSSSATQGSYNPVANTWTVGSVANATTQTLTITVSVISPNPEANTASISHSDQFDPNTANNSDTASINPQEANLELIKTVDDPTPNVGDTITFTVALINNGPSDATGVQVSDMLPAGLTLLSASPSQGNYDGGTGVWDVGTLANGGLATLVFQARVVSSSAQTNTATITSSDQFDPNPGNNTASATETPQQADLQLTKTVSNATPVVGNTVTFTITLTNDGPSTATAVQVRDLLPPGLTFVSAVPSQGTYNPATGVWTVGDVPAGTPLTLLLTATVSSLAVQTNTATITNSDQFDPDTGNNEGSATVTPRPEVANLAVTKVANRQQVVIGQLVRYTITVRNLGPDSATNVIATDQLPAGLVFVSAQPSQGTYNSVSGRWRIPTLAANGVATLRITAEVMAVGTIRNKARVAFPGIDPDLSNNAARNSIIGLAADDISKRMLLGSTFF